MEPQWVLEYWSDTHGVFTFVRVEDIAYDKRPGMQNVVYVVDSGRGSSSAVSAGVLRRTGACGSSSSTRPTRRS